jgi:hypothetical protein
MRHEEANNLLTIRVMVLLGVSARLSDSMDEG